MSEYYVVNNDSSVVIMEDIENQIVGMICSDYYPAVFRMGSNGVEYAEVDLDTETFTWVKPLRF